MAARDAYRAVLSLNLPGEVESELLRVCLLDRESSQGAWNALEDRGIDVSRLLTHGGHGMRRLAPLLYEAISAHGLQADTDLLTRCRMATLREELRAGTFGRISAGVFDALGEAGIPFAVLKGAALAESVYGSPALRHSHDLELLVPEDRIRRAARTLLAAGCVRGEPLSASGRLRVYHDSGLPIVLRTRLFEPELYGGDWNQCEPMLSTRTVSGRQVTVLRLSAALQHACVHASYGHGRSSLQWVTDALHLIRTAVADPKDERLEWTEVADGVRLFPATTIPFHAALEYLCLEMAAAVPEFVRDRVRRSAEAASPLEREVALRCLWWGRPDDVTRALRAELRWTQRIGIAARIVVPSPSYAAYRLGGRPGPRSLARYYLGRARSATNRLLMATR